MIRTKNATGPDGVANSSTTLEATSAGERIIQSVTDASDNRVMSVYIRRVNGVGTIDISQDNSAFTDVTSLISSTWTRVNTPDTTLSNPTFAIRMAVSGDIIEIYGVQSEASGTGDVTSPIITFGSQVTRPVDDIRITNSLFPLPAMNNTSDRLSIYATVGAKVNKFCIAVDPGNSSTGRFVLTQNTSTLMRLSGNFGDPGDGKIDVAVNEFDFVKISYRVGENDWGLATTGEPITTTNDANPTTQAVSTIHFGSRNNSIRNVLNHTIGEILSVPRGKSNTELLADVA